MNKKANHHLHTMSLFSLIMVSAAITTSVRNLPTIAETGFHMLFFAVIAAIFGMVQNRVTLFT